MTKISSSSKALLAKLEETDWFRSVGEPIADATVPRIRSWKEAVALRTSRLQKNIANESANALTEKLCFEFPKRYHGKWNKLVTAVRKIWDPISATKIKKVMMDNKLNIAFVDSVNWDILFSCMELEYADLVPPRFFKERLDWYLAGHFPCGWDGVFPDGRLIVF
jgi:hypothetical protein